VWSEPAIYVNLPRWRAKVVYIAVPARGFARSLLQLASFTVKGDKEASFTVNGDKEAPFTREN